VKQSSVIFNSQSFLIAFVVLVVGFVIFAGVALVAVAAIFGRLAKGFFWGKLFAIHVVGERGYRGLAIEGDGLGVYVLGGDLEAIEEEPGALGIESGGTERVEDLGEGDLDGLAIFQDRDVDGLVSAVAFSGGVEVTAGVEVAVWLAGENRRLAPGSAGHDMATLFMHYDPSPPYSVRWWFVFNRLAHLSVVKY
jgi:hypothetical protein